jgi:zona occludens toxin (predicted ATPase)
MSIEQAVGLLLRRSPHTDRCELSFEKISDEAGCEYRDLDNFAWSDDPTELPGCREWQNIGWQVTEVDRNRETITFRRHTPNAEFVGDGTLRPDG